jgi:hypothetical protein
MESETIFPIIAANFKQWAYPWFFKEIYKKTSVKVQFQVQDPYRHQAPAVKAAKKQRKEKSGKIISNQGCKF